MIGIDIVSIKRIESMVARFGDRALFKFLNQNEIDICKKSSTLAGFWAAKEAASKAIGTGIGAHCSFHDIQISKNSFGAPQIKFSNKIIDDFKIKCSSVSITHDGGFAIAVVAIETSS